MRKTLTVMTSNFRDSAMPKGTGSGPSGPGEEVEEEELEEEEEKRYSLPKLTL